MSMLFVRLFTSIPFNFSSYMQGRVDGNKTKDPYLTEFALEFNATMNKMRILLDRGDEELCRPLSCMILIFFPIFQ